jgi:hypothetical protein
MSTLRKTAAASLLRATTGPPLAIIRRGLSVCKPSLVETKV